MIAVDPGWDMRDMWALAEDPGWDRLRVGERQRHPRRANDMLARLHPPYRCRLLGIAPLTPGGLVCGYVPAMGQGSHALPASPNLARPETPVRAGLSPPCTTILAPRGNAQLVRR